MSTDCHLIKVFLASPMDAIDERNCFRKTVSQLNDVFGRKLGVEYDVVCWEDYVTPDLGIDAQDVVNQQINLTYDIFLAIFKDRIGTATKRYSSGTIEEYERAKLLKCTKTDLKIMCYFIGENNSIEIKHLKEKFNEDGTLFCETKDTELFEDTIYKHFSSLLIEYSKKRLDENTTKKEAFYSKRSVAVAISSGNRVIIVKRSKNNRIGAGYWQIPGGKVDKDESIFSAGVREIKEELSLGIEESQLRLIGNFFDNDIFDKSKKIQISLFLCNITPDENEIHLNDENEQWQWLDLSDFFFSKIKFLGANKEMIISVWREKAFAEKLELILSLYDETTGIFPLSVEDLSSKDINSLYGILNVLGLLQLHDGHVVPSSEYSLLIIDAIISLSRSGKCFFSNDQIDFLNTLKLQKNEYALVNENRNRLLHSHKALLSLLSCATELRNSVRKVCDVLIFGEYNNDLFLLMRWDFFSKKYQLISSGLEDSQVLGDFTENAKYVVSRRMGKTMNHFFNYFGVGQFTTRHFSAGSVNKDPILRTYHIDVVSAQPKKRNSDIIDIISNINESTVLSLQYSDIISKEAAKDYLFFRWCNINELFENKISYHNMNVRGIDELISNIGKSVIMSHSQTPIILNDILSEDSFQTMITTFNDKLVIEKTNR